MTDKNRKDVQLSICKNCSDNLYKEWEAIDVYRTTINGKKEITVEFERFDKKGGAIQTCLNCKHNMEHMVMSQKLDKIREFRT